MLNIKQLYLALLTILYLLPATTIAAPPDFANMMPTEGMVQEAKHNPNGWVYAIEGNYGPDDAVPPEAIVGAWQVDASGNIIKGSYRPNPKFESKQ